MDYLSLRLLSSFCVGMIISQTGSLLQLGTKNTLASPSTLGFDGFAILWVLIFHSIGLILPHGLSPLIGIPLFIFLGLGMSQLMRGREKFERLILLGLSFNLLIGAVFSLWQFLFLAFNLPFPVELWFGHFRFVSPTSLYWVVGLELTFIGSIFYLLPDLRVFSLGREVARNYGLNGPRLFRYILVLVAVGTFVVVNLFGAFSFLGLLFPIVARKLWFNRFDLEGEFLYGALVNGIVLMLLDALCYFLPIYGAEIPTGLIVTAVGAVSLILLLWASQKDSETVAKPKK